MQELTYEMTKSQRLKMAAIGFLFALVGLASLVASFFANGVVEGTLTGMATSMLAYGITYGSASLFFQSRVRTRCR